MSAYVVEQRDKDGNCLGAINGPFNREDIALASTGHDSDSVITYYADDGKETILHKWDDDSFEWKRVARLKKVLQGTDILLDPLMKLFQDVASGLPLVETTIRGHGKPNPKLMVIGDYPEDCDTNTCYEKGQLGEILKQALLDAGYRPNEVYLTTLTKHALYSDKDKLSYEDARPFVPLILKEIEIVAPQAVVILGLFAAQVILGIPKLNQKEGLCNFYVLPQTADLRFRLAYHPKYIWHQGGIECNAYKYYPLQFQQIKKPNAIYTNRSYYNT